MKKNSGKKGLNVTKWIARILAVAIIIFALPFYFGYGNPLPFANPENSAFDNIWLSAFPIVFIGLALGWKYEKIGGYLVIVPIILASIIGFTIRGEGVPGPMFVPLVVGVLYLVVGYLKR
ncbi:MAG: hypothetical protein KC506_01605 [Nanoarchaeota archaeon]|nr:hypothetical protein [Nanoarchaeota archaeon]